MSRRGRPGCIRGERGRILRSKLARRDGRRCFYCRTPFKRPAVEATLDHYLPYSLCRINRPWNLVLACQPCNEAKGDTLPLPLVWLLVAHVGSSATP